MLPKARRGISFLALIMIADARVARILPIALDCPIIGIPRKSHRQMLFGKEAGSEANVGGKHFKGVSFQERLTGPADLVDPPLIL
jgi:hypothetical protein